MQKAPERGTGVQQSMHSFQEVAVGIHPAGRGHPAGWQQHHNRARRHKSKRCSGQRWNAMPRPPTTAADAAEVGGIDAEFAELALNAEFTEAEAAELALPGAE